MRRTWSEEDERDFARRIARTGAQRGMYLVLQAGVLIDSGEREKLEAALRLLACVHADCPPDDLHRPRAFLLEADARLALGRVAEALEASRAALRAEVESRVKSYAYLAFAWNAARRGPPEIHDEALAVLKQHQEAADLAFPDNAYRYFGALALIADARGEAETARGWARDALAAAARPEGPFRSHPSGGVVDAPDAEADARLRRIAQARR